MIRFSAGVNLTRKSGVSLLRKSGVSLSGNSNYIPESEAKKLLDKKTTWFWQMRTNGKLPFSKVGNKVFYQKSDIVKLLENNKSEENFERFPLRKAA